MEKLKAMVGIDPTCNLGKSALACYTHATLCAGTYSLWEWRVGGMDIEKFRDTVFLSVVKARLEDIEPYQRLLREKCACKELHTYELDPQKAADNAVKAYEKLVEEQG